MKTLLQVALGLVITAALAALLLRVVDLSAVVAAIAPGRRAARLQVVAALQYE